MDLRLICWVFVALFVVLGALVLPSQGINNVIKIPVKVARWGILFCILAMGLLVIVFVSILLK